MSDEVQYVHHNIKDAVFNLVCLAYPYVKMKSLVDNLHKDCKDQIEVYEREHKALEVIRDFVKDMMKCVDIVPPSQGGGTKVLVSSEDFEYIYECKNQEEADLFWEALK